MEGYRIRVKEKDITLDKVLWLHIDHMEFVVQEQLFPNVNDSAWRCTWESVMLDFASSPF
jgi:hypothetical protein